MRFVGAGDGEVLVGLFGLAAADALQDLAPLPDGRNVGEKYGGIFYWKMLGGNYSCRGNIGKLYDVVSFTVFLGNNRENMGKTLGN